MRRFIYSTLHPEIYHGYEKRAPFFEGWYYKLVSPAEDQRYAIIPGVFRGPDEHAFIQILEGHTRRSAYHVFPLSAFRAAREHLEIQIGDSTFRRDSLELALDRPGELGQLNGRVEFSGIHPWPVTLTSPGIMGWYAWAPGMECYHGVLSFDHRLQGSLQVENETVTLTGGRGYIEKDWGQAFPEAYIWFQSNHFGQPGSQSQPGISLTASIAIIPWMGNAFRGLIIGLWLDGKLYRFATYTGARVENLVVTDQRILWVVSDRRYRLEMQITQADGGQIRGPNRHDMGRRVDETLDASVELNLTRRNGQSIFTGLGRHAGLEMNGDLARLLQMK